MADLFEKSVDFSFGAIEYFFPKRGEVETVIIKEVEKLSEPMSGTGFVRLAGLAGGTAVMMAAYGAHAFPQGDDEETMKAKAIFESGNKMHIMHSLALMGVPLTNRPKLIGSLMISGMAIFSGTCYYTAITGNTKVRKFTPYGGMLLIISWFLMML